MSSQIRFLTQGTDSPTLPFQRLKQPDGNKHTISTMSERDFHSLRFHADEHIPDNTREQYLNAAVGAALATGAYHQL